MKYFKLRLNYNKAKVSLKSISLESLEIGPSEEYGSCSAKLIDEAGKEVEYSYFDFPLKKTCDYINPKTREMAYARIETTKNVDKILFLPYNEAGKRVYVYNENLKRVLSFNVPKNKCAN